MSRGRKGEKPKSIKFARKFGAPAATRTRDHLLRRLLKPYQECDLLRKIACFLRKSRGADPGVSVRWRSGGIISGITKCDLIGADLLLNELFVEVEGAISIIPLLYHLPPNNMFDVLRPVGNGFVGVLAIQHFREQ